jgi:nanoRNase/pAp phosphatase (c-di-AMP/oligoRNAs hydrolase)
VNAFARQFGGGGHKNASGAYFEEPLDRVVARVVPAAVTAFDPAAG